MMRLLGKGGMGSVYLAEDHALKRQVAIKIISEKLAQDHLGRNRFVREARAMATLDHPNVVHFHSFEEFSGQPYIVMEYVDGETLAERIKREGALPLNESLRILQETVHALNAAWEKQVIHRDVKPSNILLDKKGGAHVADFGLAKPIHIDGDFTLTQSGSIIGSPHYISPEQAQGHTADFRSDIYALGIVLYEMLVGERPFEDTTPLAIVLKHLNAPMPSPRLKRPNIPESVVRLLQWMTRKDPAKRPASYAQLLERIDSLLQKKTHKSALRKSTIYWMVGFTVLLFGILFAYRTQPPVRKITPITKSVSKISPPTPLAVSQIPVSINALPWARVKIVPLTKGIEVPAIPEMERITPCNFSLAEGDYVIELTNDSLGQPVQKKIKVESAKDNAFVFTMPAYDAKQALAQIRGAR
jgi:serine/threonine protein kinase